MEGAAEELGLVGLWTPTKVTVGKNWGALVSIDAFVAEKYRCRGVESRDRLKPISVSTVGFGG